MHRHQGGRDVYIEDSLYKAVYDVAEIGLRDAMDLAYLTGQRVTDTRLMDERDVRDGFIWVKQAKTKAKRRIEVVGSIAGQDQGEEGRPQGQVHSPDCC